MLLMVGARLEQSPLRARSADRVRLLWTRQRSGATTLTTQARRPRVTIEILLLCAILMASGRVIRCVLDTPGLDDVESSIQTSSPLPPDSSFPVEPQDGAIILGAEPPSRTVRLSDWPLAFARGKAVQQSAVQLRGGAHGHGVVRCSANDDRAQPRD